MKLPFLQFMFIWAATFFAFSAVMAVLDVISADWWALGIALACLPLNAGMMKWYGGMIRTRRRELRSPNYAEIQRLEREVFGRD